MNQLSEDSIDVAGFVDLHIHSAPDVKPCKLDDIDVARAAADAGLKAILLKSHVTGTADRAAIAEKIVPSIRVFGGLVLDHSVGGINPAAVETALRLGAREIWLPTFSASGNGKQPGGLTIDTEDGRLLPSVVDVFCLVAEADIILGTGHVSVPEVVLAAREARRLGVRKVLITHPDGRLIDMPLAIQRELAGMGMLFERCYQSGLYNPGLGVEGLAWRIREIGVASTVISTDLGRPADPAPVDGLRRYLRVLSNGGLSEDEIRLMGISTPSALLGI